MTDTTRDAFEAEAKTLAMNLMQDKNGYINENTSYGWVMWHAATLAAKHQPLTDEQIDKCVEQVWGSFAEFDEVRLFARAIESAHGIKA